MKKSGVFKNCRWCKKSFYVKKCLIESKFFCSKECCDSWKKGKNISPDTQFKKGQASWNKDTKGVMKPNSGSFKEGILNPNFKGEIKHQGYVLTYSPDHPFRDRYKHVKRSRLVMEKKIGRFLKPNEVVHHINRIRDDDRPKNLMLFANNSKHAQLHYPKGCKPTYIRNKLC